MKDFSEKTIEDIIMENKDCIHDKGLCPLLKSTQRQYKLQSGKRADIVSIESKEDEIMVYLIEIKKNNTDLCALNQAYGYLKELITLFSKVGFQKMYCKVILIGKDFQNTSILEFLNIPVEIYNYSYGINGIQFKQLRVVNPVFGDGSIYENEGGATIDLERRCISNSLDSLLASYINYNEPNKG